MKLVRRTFVSLAILAIVFIAILSGCSGSDPLSTTVGNLVLEFQVTDAGSSQYELATLLVGRASVRPVSQEARDSIGDAGISLLTNDILEMDLNAASTALPAASLPAGSFVLDELNFFPAGFISLVLVDDDPDAMAACLDRMPELPRGILDDDLTTNGEIRIAQGLGAVSVDRKTFQPNTVISIPSGEAVVYPIQINSTMLIQAYKSAISCSDSDIVCRVSRGGQVPCVTGFNGNAFFDALDGLDWITY